MKPTTVLCILDGVGLNPNEQANAVALADTPVLDRLMAENPSTTLTTFGERVGLPEGQMGNSEVGHLNIGAGRVVEQWLVQIRNEFSKHLVGKKPAFSQFLQVCSSAPALHLVGLFSDGGVHSHIDHLYATIAVVREQCSTPIVLHLITDGRDTSPHQALEQVRRLEEKLVELRGVSIGTVCGRFFAMDRDKRWERTEKAYRAIVSAEAPQQPSASAYIAASYEAGVTDEFLEPAVISPTPVRSGDGIIFWNFRADRMRQIVSALCLKDFDGFERGNAPFAPDRTLCFAEYSAAFNLPFLFAPPPIDNNLGEVLSNHKLTQLRTAETEKYPHVTYFLNGGKEAVLPGESRELVPSPRDVKTYDLKPEMSARGVKDIVVRSIASGANDVIVVNFANGDMVGHTGVLPAAIKAVETVDTCLGEILAALQAVDGRALIIADHGNAEQLINYDDGSPHTAHTTHPVPCILVNGPQGATLRSGGALCDVAPTLLELLDIPQPAEMTGESLLTR